MATLTNLCGRVSYVTNQLAPVDQYKTVKESVEQLQIVFRERLENCLKVSEKKGGVGSSLHACVRTFGFSTRKIFLENERTWLKEYFCYEFPGYLGEGLEVRSCAPDYPKDEQECQRYDDIGRAFSEFMKDHWIDRLENGRCVGVDSVYLSLQEVIDNLKSQIEASEKQLSEFNFKRLTEISMQFARISEKIYKPPGKAPSWRQKLAANGYLVVSQIGSGYQADVYKVVRRDGVFAAKVIRGHRERGRVAWRTWWKCKEWEGAARVQHPNLLQTHAVLGDKRGVQIIISPFMPGGTLEDVRKALPEVVKEGRKVLSISPERIERCRQIMREVVLGVRALHAAGLVHRDLKGENIYLDEKGHCKIADFGFMRSIRYLGKSEEGLGSPLYSAPEIYDGWYDHRVDNWSMGVLFFKLLCGAYPHPDFVGQSMHRLVSSLENWEGATWNKFPHKGVDEKLDSARDLISELLVKDSRYRLTAEEALKHPFLAI